MCSSQSGFKVEPNQVTFEANAFDWAALVRVLGRLDTDRLSDADRLCFSLWVQAAQCAVQAAICQAWLDEQGIAKALEDLQEYLL